MFGRSKGPDSSQILVLQRLMEAEVKAALRKEQGNFDLAVRNTANAIQQKNKANSLANGKKICEAKRKLELLQLLQNSVTSIKKHSDEISKGTVNAEITLILSTINYSADNIKSDGLVKFKNTVIKTTYKNNLQQFSQVDKLSEPLKTIISRGEISDDEVVSTIRSECPKFCRDPKLIDSLFGTAQVQQTRPQPVSEVTKPTTQQEPSLQTVAYPKLTTASTFSQIPSASELNKHSEQKTYGLDSLKISRRAPASHPIKPTVREHSELFTVATNEPFKRENWPSLLSAIKSVAH